jgi:hypothetical protein
VAVQEQAVKSPDASLRATCSATLLQFLLDWPLQEHRLLQHLHFLLSNLSFELEHGRLQVLRPGGLFTPAFRLQPACRSPAATVLLQHAYAAG